MTDRFGGDLLGASLHDGRGTNRPPFAGGQLVVGPDPIVFHQWRRQPLSEESLLMDPEWVRTPAVEVHRLPVLVHRASDLSVRASGLAQSRVGPELPVGASGW